MLLYYSTDYVPLEFSLEIFPRTIAAVVYLKPFCRLVFLYTVVHRGSRVIRSMLIGKKPSELLLYYFANYWKMRIPKKNFIVYVLPRTSLPYVKNLALHGHFFHWQIWTVWQNECPTMKHSSSCQLLMVIICSG